MLLTNSLDEWMVFAGVCVVGVASTHTFRASVRAAVPLHDPGRGVGSWPRRRLLGSGQHDLHLCRHHRLY